MSRIGKMPVALPDGVSAELKGDLIVVKGGKGSLDIKKPKLLSVEVENGVITIKRSGETRQERALHGLTRALVNNMVLGVSKGFTRELVVKGVGYRAEMKGKVLHMQLGFSHPVVFPLPEGITAEVDNKTKIKILGISKQSVGQVAANIRALRPPEPYGGKGVRYSDEVIKRKEGKSGAK